MIARSELYYSTVQRRLRTIKSAEIELKSLNLMLEIAKRREAPTPVNAISVTYIAKSKEIIPIDDILSNIYEISCQIGEYNRILDNERKLLAELEQYARDTTDRLTGIRLEIFNLAYINGKSFMEIAKILDYSPGTIANRLTEINKTAPLINIM